MKRICSFIVAMALLLSLCACGGNYAQVDLREPIALSEEGIVEKNVLDQIKKDNAIATFTGKSGDITYEWTVFGSDLGETKDVNLSVQITEVDGGIKVTFSEEQDLGFSALLSIRLNDKWTVDGATAYQGETGVYSVSITGSKTSILNLSIRNMVSECSIFPDSTASSDSNTSTNQGSTESTTESTTESITGKPNQGDDYLSDVPEEDDRVYSDGNATNQDKYQTDPVPEGKPMPVEPENQEVNTKKSYTCIFSIECSTILNNLKDLDPDKLELVPSNGVILAPTEVTFYEGESVFDVLQRVCKEYGIHMESAWTPIYNSAYIEGIHNLYEFDCGALSGWMYRVDGWYPNYGCSRYQLKEGEKVEWRYTCDLGKDVGCDWLAGS